MNFGKSKSDSELEFIATTLNKYDIPEEYQLGLVYYACYNYYLKRNEMANATTFKGLYEELLSRFIDVYAAKTTGIVQKSISDDIFNIFWLPPGTMS